MVAQQDENNSLDSKVNHLIRCTNDTAIELLIIMVMWWWWTHMNFMNGQMFMFHANDATRQTNNYA